MWIRWKRAFSCNLLVTFVCFVDLFLSRGLTTLKEFNALSFFIYFFSIFLCLYLFNCISHVPAGAFFTSVRIKGFLTLIEQS